MEAAPSRSASAAPADIAFFSVASDREHIAPLVQGLRSRDIRVWWDADSVEAGEDWWARCQQVAAEVPITCLALSRASLASEYWLPTAEIVLGNQRRLVPLRVGLVDMSEVPEKVARIQWLDAIDQGDVTRAIDVLVTLARGTAPAGQPSFAPGSDRPPTPPDRGPVMPVRLQLGENKQVETWPVTPDTGTLFAYAARFNRETRDESAFPLSFKSILLALFLSPGRWPGWVRDHAEKTRFELDVLLRAKALDQAQANRIVDAAFDSRELSAKLRTTSTVASLLGAARSFAERSNSTLDVPHIFAAIIFAAPGHEADLQGYHFDRVGWANLLIEQLAHLNRPKAEIDVFVSLRDEAFPITKGPSQSAPPRESPLPPLGSTGEASPQPPQDLWATLDDDVQGAFAWAAVAAASRKDEPGAVGIVELFGALLDGMPPELFDIVMLLAPALQTTPPADRWAIAYTRLELPQVTAPPRLSAMPKRSAQIDQLLTAARALQDQVPDEPPDLLNVGFVLLAMFDPLTPGGEGVIDPVLRRLGIDGNALLDSMIKRVAKDVNASVLRKVFERRGAFRHWGRPHVLNDRVGDRITVDQDLLDARRPALRFAKLLAAKAVQPPIAVGLFGNWGSGKTFFMGLMRDRIADLTANGGPDYVRRVAQIEFNAWHYHDTNLWASLAMRIFEELARELGGKSETAVEARRKELHQKVRSSQARRNEASERRDQALDKRTTAAKTLEQKQADREERRKRSGTLRLKAAWRIIRSKERYKTLQQTAEGLKKHFGIDAAVGSAEDLGRLRGEISETSARAHGLFTAIGQRFDGASRSVWTVGLLVLVALLVVALGWGVDWFAEHIKGKIPDFSATVVQIAALVSAAAAWCGRRVHEIRGAIDAIDGVEQELAEEERQLQPTDDLIALQKEIDALDQEIHKATEEVSAAEREVAQATAEIDRIDRGGLVYDFLQERQKSASYTGQLGLISTIRQDLEKLDELLQDFGKLGKNPIERIILYIDDLDRCHPDKVVEVLQAVHLLLAFNLFNVVVGVDARWLERSLRRQYVGRPGSRAARAPDPFSPQDYLEKIFQIPYALAPIDQTGFKNLIGGLVETRSEFEEKGRHRELKRLADEKAKAEADASAAVEKAAAEARAAAAGAVELRIVEAVGRTDQNAAGQVEQPVVEAVEPTDQHAPGQKTDEPARGVEAALFFEDHEESFIQLLYAFIDRPRLAKRFVNIYRLLRVRADDENESATFAAEHDSPAYRAALTLLAIQVGHARIASKLGAAIERAPDATKLLGLFEDLAGGRCLSPPCSEDERAEVRTVLGKLKRVGERLLEDLKDYRDWAPRVAVYSFDWHQIDRPDSLPAPPGTVADDPPPRFTA